jgi:hypothetical protein
MERNKTKSGELLVAFFIFACGSYGTRHLAAVAVSLKTDD